MCQDSATRTLFGQHHFAHLLPLNAGDVVMLGKPTIDECEVRIDEIAGREIGLNQLVEKELRLRKHGLTEQFVEFGIELDIGGCSFDLTQQQPLIEEIIDESP